MDIAINFTADTTNQFKRDFFSNMEGEKVVLRFGNGILTPAGIVSLCVSDVVWLNHEGEDVPRARFYRLEDIREVQLPT